MRYLPIHVHSAFSFLYGSFSPEDLVKKIAQQKGTGVLLSDFNGLYGLVRLAREGKKNKIYTLCGARVSLESGGSLLLYPRNEKAHGLICRLITKSHMENPRGRARCALTWLNELKDVCAVICGQDALIMGEDRLKKIKSLFSGHLFLGLGAGEISSKNRDFLRKQAFRLGIMALACPEIVALDEKGYKTHRALVKIAQTIHHRNIEPLPENTGILYKDKELTRFFTDQEIKNTWEIADLCPWQLELGRNFLPQYPLFKNQTPQRELTQRALKELARRRFLDKAYAQRLMRELKLINEFGFAPYFLLVSDIVKFARKKNIRCTVRGSAAGSMVTWLLCGGVDPIEHDLLFERFLNDGRKELPDVDLDFDSLKRDEVFRYLMKRFPGRSAMVGTIPTFRARSAIRELVLSQGGTQEQAKSLTAFVPYWAKAHNLPRLLKKTPEMANHPLAKKPELLETAAALSGLARQLSVHLGGVALGPLDDLIPLELSAQALPVIQLDKTDAEDLGLVKMDLLGLRMHSALALAQEALAQKNNPVNLDDLPLDDPKVYDLLCSTDTVGLFQVESPGQRGLLGRLQPQNFHDLMIEISLFRPGPMQADMVTPYIERRHGREKPTYCHPALAKVLKETQGVLVFQEQVLRIAHHLAGLSYGQADGIRRAMTHKRTMTEMNSMRENFLQSCERNGVGSSVSGLVWDQISSFASYGFPKAHAAAFAHITYQSAWLRVHHPLEFFLGLLNAGHVGSYPPRVLINEARRLGISILPPHVNQSSGSYQAEGNAIRVGLLVIRGIGPAGVKKNTQNKRNRRTVFQL